MSLCPCGSEKPYDQCCGPIIAGAAAPTAEALMRSRYSAYVKRDYDHLEKSLCADQRVDYSREEAQRWAESAEWKGLTILRTVEGQESDDKGLVEFSAKYHMNGQDHEHLEMALFGREEGRWVYAGQMDPKGKTVRYEQPKPGRNDPCPCGSGKKYKKCCGANA
ncbi:MAG TPA: YchJ family metal-binding protein [Opitutaceae bacterium]|nr:YchJ family metal-binding protein [Opitutaceae bacterium]HOR24265.1 YchJ family metal-binding protein [Opitutaceae bacterium]HOY54352.1 YchJ family metal-binding protein [Opitutaceae bacterium]HPG17624.1 YchJ family metal-binding protein [Opitutaceae bacterium]HPK48707.1 YchJ family metal-binding protein [Opitutaceae bacterium]